MKCARLIILLLGDFILEFCNYGFLFDFLFLNMKSASAVRICVSGVDSIQYTSLAQLVYRERLLCV